MKIWKNKLVPFVWLFGGAVFLLPMLKQIIKEEPITGGPLFFALVCFAAAVASQRAYARKKETASE